MLKYKAKLIWSVLNKLLKNRNNFNSKDYMSKLGKLLYNHSIFPRIIHSNSTISTSTWILSPQIIPVRTATVCTGRIKSNLEFRLKGSSVKTWSWLLEQCLLWERASTLYRLNKLKCKTAVYKCILKLNHGFINTWKLLLIELVCRCLCHAGCERMTIIGAES